MKIPEWSKRLRILRKKAGLTGEGLAEKSGLTQGYLSQLETGKRNFTQRSLDAILKALNATYVDLFIPDALEIIEIPVFNAGAGEPSSFTDQGYPTGFSAEYTIVPRKGTDENTFGVKVNGDSMTSIVDKGDTAIVVPSAELFNGCICFATWPDERRMIKKYYRYGDTVVLRSTKEGEEEITLNTENASEVRIYRVTRIMKEV